jgi:hypothetical protein
LAELDEAVRRAAAATTAAQTETMTLAAEMRVEEAARVAAEEKVHVLTAEMAQRAAEAEIERQQRANARAADQAMQHAQLQRELVTLERALATPYALTLAATEPYHAEASTEALWASLLAEPPVNDAYNDPHVPPSISYAASDDQLASEATSVPPAGGVHGLPRPPALEVASTPATRVGRVA